MKYTFLMWGPRKGVPFDPQDEVPKPHYIPQHTVDEVIGMYKRRFPHLKVVHRKTERPAVAEVCIDFGGMLCTDIKWVDVDCGDLTYSFYPPDAGYIKYAFDSIKYEGRLIGDGEFVRVPMFRTVRALRLRDIPAIRAALDQVGDEPLKEHAGRLAGLDPQIVRTAFNNPKEVE